MFGTNVLVAFKYRDSNRTITNDMELSAVENIQRSVYHYQRIELFTRTGVDGRKPRWDHEGLWGMACPSGQMMVTLVSAVFLR